MKFWLIFRQFAAKSTALGNGFKEILFSKFLTKYGKIAKNLSGYLHLSSFVWFVSCVTGSFIATRQVNRLLVIAMAKSI
jgi:hypothetical protein